DKIKFKEGDEAKFSFHCQTTDKVILFASNGRFYTLGADKLPGGRGHGEPVRLMIDLGNEEEIMSLFIYEAGTKILIAAETGRGFMAESDKVIASTKNGKQVMNVEDGANKAILARIIDAEHDNIAIVGQNRKLLVFPIDQMPEMTRGRGAVLQKYKGGNLGDIISFNSTEGLSWEMRGGKTRTETDLMPWTGKRGQVGRMPPHGFPSNNKFSR
ncbi:MAG: DNA gyrase C-terminal beta-propeller domain-containing protein, partial [Emcibacteraceae bacterium]|nr:DNA gyrase C-terminal beta-propeller domain-containing protein [Emcibacteraceae bacterium]